MTNKLSALLTLLSLPVLAGAATTEILPLSGMGQENETPVYWDFRLDQGRGSGEWKRIVVPSCWEQQGFGTYYYGTQGRGKPDDDPIIPKETGTYRRSFEIPAAWRGREIHIVFEAAMTDTTVLINGQQAGDPHQGGFYRFSYDITKLVKTGRRNDIEVRVAKESANKSVNTAERRGDYWTFGGIYRPVWLEARPREHIAWTTIDARADGSFTARLHLNGSVPRWTRARAEIFDAAGKSVMTKTGAAIVSEPISGDAASLNASFDAPALWTAETPNLHTVKFSLVRGKTPLHELEQRFGFRTIEVRPRDGVYLNGRKIVLKGVNRHSFNPDTGRTLTRAQNFADARLIKGANMNAVRMSHYPPDPSFLEAADELGLYVLDELAGWQGFYDAPTGARLIGQMIRRDVNHPSILFWDNGNEGGWNTANDGEFDRWDPQRRPVLHPWAVHSGINTDHYENYDSTVKLSAGPDIFMPTEFLHGLYDGGIGAGLRDYWDVMGRSPTVAGGFFWAFADEGLARTDRGGRIDNVGNSAPDGLLGPRHEKEGSYFAVKELWSPVVIDGLTLADGKLGMRIENRYDFTQLDRCTMHWRALRMTEASEGTSPIVLAEGRAPLPPLAPHANTNWIQLVGHQRLAHNEVLEVSIHDPAGAELWTWVLRGVAEPKPESPRPRVRRNGNVVEAGNYRLEFDPRTGRLARLEHHGHLIPLRGPTLAAWHRESGLRSYKSAAPEPVLQRLTLAPGDSPSVLARAEYAGALRELIWTLNGNELVLRYRIDYRGSADLLGLSFDFPEAGIVSKRWLGAGPYRVWKNRMAGTQFGLHATDYSRSIPGEIFAYPEFHGFFGDWAWVELRSRDGNVMVRNASGVPSFGLYTPAGGEKPVLDLPELGWTFLHAIPPIGTKFALPDVLGPESQAAAFDGELRGELAFSFTP